MRVSALIQNRQRYQAKSCRILDRKRRSIWPPSPNRSPIDDTRRGRRSNSSCRRTPFPTRCCEIFRRDLRKSTCRQLISLDRCCRRRRRLRCESSYENPSLCGNIGPNSSPIQNISHHQAKSFPSRVQNTLCFCTYKRTFEKVDGKRRSRRLSPNNRRKRFPT